jgi:hypothetical protein
MPAVIDNDALQAVFAQPKPDGAFEGNTLSYLSRVGANRPVLFLAFAPKAAGTFFRQAAMHTIDGELIRVAHAQGGRDGTPHLPNLLSCYLDNDLAPIVTHIHMQAFSANLNLLKAFGIRPVIMLRNIPDMLASFWDMLNSDAVARAEGLNCVVPDNFVDLSHAQKADFIIDAIAPWYASYFASWKSFFDKMPKQICVLRYRNFCQQPAESLHAALTHAGFVVSRLKCETSLAQVWSQRSALRYNKGKEGRGKVYFSPHNLEEISRKLSHYPHLDGWMSDLTGVNSTVRKVQTGAFAIS